MALAAAASSSSLTAASAATATAHQASPFAYLLRHSRFATFDPSIRQTYYSPKQFVTRGYWGLKRPIAARKKTSSFIAIKTWEAREHYVEWDNAEDQVRFIRRMEELDTRPGINASSRWAAAIGAEATQQWVMDSEFAPRDWEKAASEVEDKHVPGQDISLGGLGTRGPGAYGAGATSARRGGSKAVIPNVDAMSPAQFRRYLARVRSLRPAFKEYLRKHGEAEHETYEKLVKETGEDITFLPRTHGKDMLTLAIGHQSQTHRLFLAEHTASEYATSPTKIQPRPHRNGALTYTHPSMLDTLFRTKPKPGIVVEEVQDRVLSKKVSFIAAFAGCAAVLTARDAPGLWPIMSGSQGAHRDEWPTAVTILRPKMRNGFVLSGVPRVVGRGRGREPHDGLDGVRVELNLTTHAGARDLTRPNPFPPGSREYNAMMDLKQAAADGKEAAMAAAQGPTAGEEPRLSISYLHRPSPFESLQRRGDQLGAMSPPVYGTRKSVENRTETMKALSQYVTNGGGSVPDEKL
ncbi:hypothetical protein HMN09_01244000 [Mycena chlorophos]|uniref:Uncharacterized protein n=1 Tax=Mycena chlorophos TaxID=658473 RepID=A0A8H6S361_MYCCL|nr:hypothetical protein HMN09_01244000 [Mycena chlorophos]